MSAIFVKRDTAAYTAILADKLIIYNGIKVVDGNTYYYSVVDGNKIWYNNQGTIVPSPVYLTFTPSTGTVSVTPSSCWNATTKQYSIDGGTTWLAYSSGAVTGTTVMFRGLGGTQASAASDLSAAEPWTISGTNVAASGNVETILDYQTVVAGNHPTMGDYCFGGMFQECTCLTTPPELPATTLSVACYCVMFYGCTSLTTAPALPATILDIACYYQMFYGCSSLTTAPSLPATTMKVGCYQEMFYTCTSLTTAPALPATTLAKDCYSSMFVGCTSLTTAPNLPATTMAENCYFLMFSNCTSLKFSETQTAECPNVYRLPTSGTGVTASGWNSFMFMYTGGTFKGSPAINTNYYTNATII